MRQRQIERMRWIQKPSIDQVEWIHVANEEESNTVIHQQQQPTDAAPSTALPAVDLQYRKMLEKVQHTHPHGDPHGDPHRDVHRDYLSLPSFR